MALRGHVFDKQLFSSDCYALVTDTFLGKQSGIIRGCDMTHTTSLIHINEGYFVVKGRPIQEEGGSNIEVEPGNIDGSYCKLVCELDMSKNNTTTELNQVSYKIVEDATNYPVLTQEDITDTGIIYQFELAKFRRTLNGIEDFVDTRSFLNFDSIYEEVRNEIKKIEDGSIFVTEEEMREVGVAVSPTQPETGEKVWLQKGKNLFNLLCIPINSSNSTASLVEKTTNSVVLKGSASTYQYLTLKKDLKAGTYAFKRKWKVISGTSNGNTGAVIISKDTDNSTLLVLNQSTSEGIFTITEDITIKIVLYLSIDNVLVEETQTEFYDIQLERDSKATEYEEYIEKKIYCKNDNGEFEEFVNVEENNPINITTGIEFETGRIINGRKEYGKMIYTGFFLGANEVLSVPHGLTNFSITKIEGVAHSSSNDLYCLLPHSDTGNNVSYNIYMTVNSSNIIITSNQDISHYDANITLYYVKL